MIVHETAINEMTVDSYLLRVLLINFCLGCISSVYGFSIKVWNNLYKLYTTLHCHFSSIINLQGSVGSKKDLTSNYPPIRSL